MGKSNIIVFAKTSRRIASRIRRNKPSINDIYLFTFNEAYHPSMFAMNADDTIYLLRSLALALNTQNKSITTN
jgi:hypothetical protein